MRHVPLLRHRALLTCAAGLGLFLSVSSAASAQDGGSYRDRGERYERAGGGSESSRGASSSRAEASRASAYQPAAESRSRTRGSDNTRFESPSRSSGSYREESRPSYRDGYRPSLSNFESGYTRTGTRYRYERERYSPPSHRYSNDYRDGYNRYVPAYNSGITASFYRGYDYRPTYRPYYAPAYRHVPAYGSSYYYNSFDHYAPRTSVSIGFNSGYYGPYHTSTYRSDFYGGGYPVYSPASCSVYLPAVSYAPRYHYGASYSTGYASDYRYGSNVSFGLRYDYRR